MAKGSSIKYITSVHVKIIRCQLVLLILLSSSSSFLLDLKFGTSVNLLTGTGLEHC